MQPGDPKYRYLYLVWACFESFGIGGLIYGWGSLVFVLKDEGMYLDLCDGQNITSGGKNDSSRSCSARDARLALVFTIGSAFFVSFGFLTGQINYRFGTRVTRLVGSVLFAAGTLMIAFTSNETPWLIFPGLSLMGGGGATFFITSNQVSLLFRSRGSLAVGLMCGSFDSSAGTILVVKIGYQAGITRFTSFIILTGVSLLTLVSTFFFLPKDFIQMSNKAELKSITEESKTQSKHIVSDSGLNKYVDKEKHESLVVRPSMKSCILSPIFILQVFWVVILQLRLLYFISSINKILTDRLDSQDEVSQYTNAFMYVLLCGFFISPLAGIMYDFSIKKFKDSRSSCRRTLMPAVVPLAFTTFVGLAASIIIIIPVDELFYLAFGLIVIFRSFLYTISAGYISSIFPNEYYAMMYGIQMLVGGVVGLSQYVLFEWAQLDSFERINAYLMVPVALTFIHPLYQWRKCRKEEQRAIYISDD